MRQHSKTLLRALNNQSSYELATADLVDEKNMSSDFEEQTKRTLSHRWSRKTQP